MGKHPYSVCQHCQVGWVWKAEKHWYPCCWNCGADWPGPTPPNPARSARQVYNTQEDWQRWEAQAWEQTAQAQEAACLATGARLGQSPAHTRRVRKKQWPACGRTQIRRPSKSFVPVALSRRTKRSLIRELCCIAIWLGISQSPNSTAAWLLRKPNCSSEQIRLKHKFEKAVQDLADVSKEIEQAEGHLVKVQTQVQAQLKEAEAAKGAGLAGASEECWCYSD